MKQRFWLFKRGSVFYVEDAESGKQQSLGTKSLQEAERLLQAKLESVQQNTLNLQLGKTYLSAHDPNLPKRTWRAVMELAMSRGKAPTQARWQRSLKCRVFDLIRDKRLIETTPEDFFRILETGGVCANIHLHALQNLATGLGWLPWPILPPKLWPQPKYGIKRAITIEEHNRILSAERNPERRQFYELLWQIGASQTDAANLGMQLTLRFAPR